MSPLNIIVFHLWMIKECMYTIHSSDNICLNFITYLAFLSNIFEDILLGVFLLSMNSMSIASMMEDTVFNDKKNIKDY